MVTRNLWQFLHRIRDSDTKAEFILWADAVCIDQKNNAEKTIGLQMMPYLFPKAKTVYCWLGQAGPTDHIAFEALDKLCKANWDPKVKREMAQLYSVDNTSDAVATRNRNALIALFKRDWFQRAWTLAEICSSGLNKPHLLCGKLALEWDAFFIGCLMLFSINGFWSEEVQGVTPMLQTYRAAVKDRRLSTLIPQVVGRAAKYDVDKLYSLHGIAAREGIHYPAPNAAWSVRTAYTIYTRAIFEVDQSLELLCHGAFSRGKDGYPTWLITPQFMSCPTRSLRSLEVSYHATHRTRPMLGRAQSADDQMLSVGGIQLGEIERTWPVQPLLDALYASNMRWREALNVIDKFAAGMGISKQYVLTGEPRALALVQTLLPNSLMLHERDGSYVSNPAPKKFYYSRYSVHFCQGRKVLLSEQELALLIDQMFAPDHLPVKLRSTKVANVTPQLRDWLEQEWMVNLVNQMTRVVNPQSGRRRLFRTARGAVGVAIDTCCGGDEIVGLFGANLPLILRKVSRTGHILKGETYVHGVMFGEGIPGLKIDRSGMALPDPRIQMYRLE